MEYLTPNYQKLCKSKFFRLIANCDLSSYAVIDNPGQLNSQHPNKGQDATETSNALPHRKLILPNILGVIDCPEPMWSFGTTSELSLCCFAILSVMISIRAFTGTAITGFFETGASVPSLAGWNYNQKHRAAKTQNMFRVNGYFHFLPIFVFPYLFSSSWVDADNTTLQQRPESLYGLRLDYTCAKWPCRGRLCNGHNYLNFKTIFSTENWSHYGNLFRFCGIWHDFQPNFCANYLVFIDEILPLPAFLQPATRSY